MTLPLTNPFTTGAVVTKTMLDSLVNSTNATAFGYLGFNQSTSTVTLATVATDFAGLGPVTFTLASQRRVLILTMAAYRLATVNAAGRMTCEVGYNSGSSASIGSVSKPGSPGHTYTTSAVQTGVNTSSSAYAFAVVLLAAGTYTAYPVVNRQNGGNGADTASAFGILALDVGSA
jgi:hypothetical protein